jgi:putative tryptophan/tyrosine transport system substrate-binding protein
MTRTIPVVFALAIDPVADGFIESLARPGGNFTGLAGWDPSNSTKLIQLLKEIAPHVARVTYIYEPAVPGMTSFVDAGVAVSRSLGVEVKGAAVRDTADIERAIATLAQEPNGALFVASNPVVFENLDLIVALAERHRLPTMGAYRFVPAGGGVMSWGSDDIDQFRRAASYVDRILKGARPADLPVEYPTKYELVLNLKAARTIGLTIPEALLLRADEVIE